MVWSLRENDSMNIYFLRHGIAADMGPPGQGDAGRPLTAEGKEKMRQIARGMKSLEIKHPVVWTSPYRRALETAQIVSQAMRSPKKPFLFEPLEPMGDPRFLVQELIKKSASLQDIMIVGHEPYLSSLISVLAFGSETGAVEMKKGSLCKVSANSLCYGACGRIEWLLAPKQLIALKQ